MSVIKGCSKHLIRFSVLEKRVRLVGEDRVTVISVGSRLMCLCSCWTISQSVLRSLFRLTGEAAVGLIALYWWTVSVEFPLPRG